MKIPVKTAVKITIAIVLLAVIVTFYWSGGAEVLTLEAIKHRQLYLTQEFSDNPLLVGGAFFMVYVMVTALSLPIASLLTLLAGGIFGFINGLLLVSFASTIGATLAFLLSRFIFRDAIQKRYVQSLEKINEGFRREGLFYIFALRLVPVFPFFLVNLVLGILPIPVRQFYLLSQIGMLPGTAVYVYAGTELGKINSLHEITSPSLLLAFALLGIFPLISKKILQAVRK